MPHQGEQLGPDMVELAVHELHATRIGHGISSIASEATMALLRERGVCCECCPTSNVALRCRPVGTEPVTFATHPVAGLLRAGVACCISTDDPTLFGVDLLDEYEHCINDIGLSVEEDLAHPYMYSCSLITQ